MTLADLRDLYAYTEWANARLFDVAATLGAEAWARDLGGSFPSLGATLAHLVGAEWIWLYRWTGNLPSSRPNWSETPECEALRSALRDVERRRAAFFGRLTEAEMDRPLTYRLFSGAVQTLPLRDVLLHVANHATYHRGQAAAMLRRLGATPPATDFLVYAVETRG